MDTPPSASQTEAAPPYNPEREGPESDEPGDAFVVGASSLVLLPSMEAMLRAVERDARRATRRLDIETYIYRSDALGQWFADVLADAVARGVRVRLLYDPLGSEKTPPAFFDALAARGVEVRMYRPAAVIARSGSYGPRDHARNIVTDDAAYTGGAAWGNEWMPRPRGGIGWHDVCLRAQGAVVEDFASAYERRWREASGEELDVGDLDTGTKHAGLAWVCDAPTGESLVYERHRAAVQRATERVWLENAYFFPPAGLLADLAAAAARGVDVRVIVPAQSDLGLIAGAARAEYTDWMAAGIGLYEYVPAMLHAKFAVVDHDWCSVGTFNANPTGLGWANESNVFVEDRAFVARVARLFETDLAFCRPVTAEAVAARSWPQRAKDHLARDFVAVMDVVRSGGR